MALYETSQISKKEQTFDLSPPVVSLKQSSLSCSDEEEGLYILMGHCSCDYSSQFQLCFLAALQGFVIHYLIYQREFHHLTKEASCVHLQR